MTVAKETRLVDYSFARPDPATITGQHYVGALRYLAPPPNSKVLDVAEAKALHAHKLAIGLVWESTGNRAAEGKAAGAADAAAAIRQAHALGYPVGCPIFFAVDFDATWKQVAAYFAGVASVATGVQEWGVYGGIVVIEGAWKDHPEVAWLWQTEAWSGGKLSGHAHLLQRANSQGAVPAGCDQNVVCRPVPLWGATGVVKVKPGGAAKPRPKPKPHPEPPPTPDPHPHHAHPLRRRPWLRGWLHRHGWHRSGK